MKKAIILILAVVAVLGCGVFKYRIQRVNSIIPDVLTETEHVPQLVELQRDEAIVSAVSQQILGKWQSVDDVRFVREFLPDRGMIDYYGTHMTSQDTWAVFTSSQSAYPVLKPLEDHTPYLQVMLGDNPDSERLYFKVEKVTPEELELIYLDRGNTLRFSKIQ